MSISKIKIKKDQTIYDFNIKAKHFYYISEGSVELYSDRKYGAVINSTLFCSQFFGHEEYFSNSNRKQRAVANEDCLLYLIDQNNMKELIEICPEAKPSLKAALYHDPDEELETTPYTKKFDEKHQDYLYTHITECPICRQKIKVNHIRYGRLVLNRLEEDFRSVYKNFDDLWYQIWRCPHCHYINFYDKFMDVDIKTQKLLAFSLPRYQACRIDHVKTDINSVLKDYQDLAKYIALYKMKPMTIARIWQCIAWILEDFESPSDISPQYDKLMEVLIDTWQNSTQLKSDIELKLAYKVALILEKDNRLEEAIRFLYKAIDTKDAAKVLRMRAADKLYDLRIRYREERGLDVSAAPSNNR